MSQEDKGEGKKLTVKQEEKDESERRRQEQETAGGKTERIRCVGEAVLWMFLSWRKKRGRTDEELCSN